MAVFRYLLRWLKQTAPKNLCLQQLKSAQEKFPEAAIGAAGYGARPTGRRCYTIARTGAHLVRWLRARHERKTLLASFVSACSLSARVGLGEKLLREGYRLSLRSQRSSYRAA